MTNLYEKLDAILAAAKSLQASIDTRNKLAATFAERPAAQPSLEDRFAQWQRSPVPQADSAAVIIYGPMGCGKTQNSHRLAAFYGKAVVVDHEPRRDPANYSRDMLVLTNTPVPGAILFDDAMAAYCAAVIVGTNRRSPDHGR